MGYLNSQYNSNGCQSSRLIVPVCVILKFNNVPLKSLVVGDWDINNNPSSSNVIYDEQSPFPPASHSASISEEPPLPITEESLMRVQMGEKTEELKGGVPEKKSTLNKNQPDKKQHSLLQKNVNRRDPPGSHGYGDRKTLLKVENGIPQRGRSASPRKPAGRYARERSEEIPGPPTTDPRRRPRDRSLSPRKGDSKSGQLSPRAGSGQDHCRKSRGRSSSPKTQPKTEGSKGRSNAEAGGLASESQRGGGRARDGAAQMATGGEQSGAARKDTKQSQSGKNRTRSPEKRSKRTDEKSLLPQKTGDAAGRPVSEQEAGGQASSGETSSGKEKTGESVKTSEKKLKQEPEDRMVLNKLEEPRGQEQGAAAKSREGRGCHPESASSARKPPITPGPWKVPSAQKATGTAGVADKRL